MKSGYVTFKNGEYILATKRGQYAIETSDDGYYLTDEGSALSRNKVLLLDVEKAAEISRKTGGRLIPLNTSKLVMTYGIKYGESGNYPTSPLIRALRAFDELEEEEILRFWGHEANKIAIILRKDWSKHTDE
ncbi:hypothetical protein [Liquorilactobacillus mali]|uniref:Uncharacterized protein n=1 Tax=Liquorilactobacillus mali KCTC 3596 = DSM 20444 TaxID=1046596 RepID=A0A0R2DZN0_9LACO|nr:hypothetical protein [Liquorilactobacillus mali]KRN09360.1 hypothetical protein FD00_GL001083 [Liquorilactobacillus mali KCTC 3596 = DSM 20444]